MDVMDCGRLKVSGFGIKDFKNMKSSIREVIYFTTNFEQHQKPATSETSC